MPPDVRHRLPVLPGLLTAALVLALAGCGEDAPDATPSAPSATPSQTPADPAAGDPAPDGDAGSADAATATPPGTELSIEETADLPIAFGRAKGLVRYRITGLEEVAASALPAAQRPGSPGAWDLTYVRIQATLLQGRGAALMNLSVGMNIEGEAKGESVLPVIMWDEFKPCYDAPPPYDETGVPVGTTWTACVPILTERRAPLDAIVFTNPGNAYRDPVRWVI